MYTAVTARRSGADGLHGHVYDISADGVRIELDEALLPGESVALCLHLPGARDSVEASASVVWVHDDADDPGPRRMALRFTAFGNNADQRRLIGYIDRELARHAA